MQIFVDLASIIRDVVTAVALIIGGGFAYFKFLKGRTFRERLRITVDGKLEAASNLLLVNASVEAENISLREFRIARQGTIIRLFAHRFSQAPSQAREASWELVGAWRVFEDRDVLEPGESLQEPKLLESPEGGFAALLIELTVYSVSGRYWKTATVVDGARAGDNPRYDEN